MSSESSSGGRSSPWDTGIEAGLRREIKDLREQVARLETELAEVRGAYSLLRHMEQESRRQEKRAKKDAAKQRALAERLVGLLLQVYYEGKCTVSVKRFLRDGSRLSPLGFPGNRAEYTLNVLLAEAQEEGDDD